MALFRIDNVSFFLKEKGFDFFQKFLKETGILGELEELGIQEGDTVKMYYHEFDYYVYIIRHYYSRHDKDNW